MKRDSISSLKLVRLMSVLNFKKPFYRKVNFPRKLLLYLLTTYLEHSLLLMLTLCIIQISDQLIFCLQKMMITLTLESSTSPYLSLLMTTSSLMKNGINHISLLQKFLTRNKLQTRNQMAGHAEPSSIFFFVVKGHSLGRLIRNLFRISRLEI